MADRDTKLSKAREKLDKFRMKKKIQEDPEKQTSSPGQSSSTSSPLMFQARASDESEEQNNLEIETENSEGNKYSNF